MRDRTSGKIQPASGAGVFAKGDVKNEKVLVECKQTEKDGFSVTRKLLSKIEKEAQSEGAEARIPLLAIEFSRFGRTYYVIRDCDFTELGGSLK